MFLKTERKGAQNVKKNKVTNARCERKNNENLWNVWRGRKGDWENINIYIKIQSVKK